jgi:[ribosomal protein S18]-alanine N-acetyltransferase
MSLSIRPLEPQDEALCAAWMVASEPWQTLGFDAARCERALQREGLERWLAVSDQGAPLGFALINYSGAFVGYLQVLCVAPEQRGQGVGSALLEFAQEQVFARHPNLFICVSEFNLGAQRLYERQGFVLVGRLEDYLASGHAELLLRKTRGPILGG